MVVKTTRITIETESLLVVRRGKTIVTWCPACCAEAEAMTLEGTSLGDIPSTLIRGWLAAGKLHPVIGKVFPLEQAREAYTLMQEGKNYGKIVLKIS